MVTIGVCEDNELQRDIMDGILEEYVKTRSVTYEIFPSGEELIQRVKRTGGFDIYILDVIMPGMNGLEVASTLRNMYDKGHIIFATASLEYAVMSYDVEAFYYMTKPVDPGKLYRILDKACAKLNPTEDVIEIRSVSGDARIKVQNVMFVELKDRAPVFYLSDGRICEGIKLRKSFRDVVEPLLSDPAFCFCGVGRVVNMRYVDALDSESILLFNGSQLYFPHSAYAELKECWRKLGR